LIYTEHLGSLGTGLRWEWQMLEEVGAR
jgi:hypothetical protein